MNSAWKEYDTFLVLKSQWSVSLALRIKTLWVLRLHIKLKCNALLIPPVCQLSNPCLIWWWSPFSFLLLSRIGLLYENRCFQHAMAESESAQFSQSDQNFLRRNMDRRRQNRLFPSTHNWTYVRNWEEIVMLVSFHFHPHHHQRQVSRSFAPPILSDRLVPRKS